MSSIQTTQTNVGLGFFVIAVETGGDRRGDTVTRGGGRGTGDGGRKAPTAGTCVLTAQVCLLEPTVGVPGSIRPCRFPRPTAHDALFRKSTDATRISGVWFAGGLGLTLGRFANAAVRSPVRRRVRSRSRRASSICFCQVARRSRRRSIPSPTHRLSIAAIWASSSTNTGDIFSAALPRLAQDRRPGDGDSVDDAPRRGPRAGTHHMFTGYAPSPALSYPSFGSVISHEFGPRQQLPPYVCIPNAPNEFAGPGYLSSAFAPFSLGADPAQGNFRVRDLNLPDGVTVERSDRRRRILDTVNRAGPRDHRIRHGHRDGYLLRTRLRFARFPDGSGRVSD